MNDNLADLSPQFAASKPRQRVEDKPRQDDESLADNEGEEETPFSDDTIETAAVAVEAVHNIAGWFIHPAFRMTRKDVRKVHPDARKIAEPLLYVARYHGYDFDASPALKWHAKLAQAIFEVEAPRIIEVRNTPRKTTDKSDDVVTDNSDDIAREPIAFNVPGAR